MTSTDSTTTTPEPGQRISIIGSVLATHERGIAGECKCGYQYDNPGDTYLHEATAVEAALTLMQLGLAPEHVHDGVTALLALLGR